VKLCYLADASSIHTQRWVKYFADVGHEVHVISQKPFGANPPTNVSLHLLQPLKVGSTTIKGANLPFQILQIHQNIRRLKPHLLHAHDALGYGFWGALCRFHPFVITPWGSDVVVSPGKSWFFKWSVQFALKNADFLTCDADHLVGTLTALGANPNKIQVIYFGVDTKKFAPAAPDGNLRARLGIAANAPVVISLRHLNPIYDIESLVRAAPLVLEKIPDARFIIAGNGTLRFQLEQLATALGIAEQLKFVGAIPNHELPDYLTLSDVYVSTSLSDGGLAASTAEAMACALPVIITDFGDNRQWVTDGKGGFLIPLRNPAVLADKIVYLLENAETRRQFGAFNRQVILERNDYYTEMAKVERIYQNLLEV